MVKISPFFVKIPLKTIRWFKAFPHWRRNFRRRAEIKERVSPKLYPTNEFVASDRDPKLTNFFLSIQNK